MVEKGETPHALAIMTKELVNINQNNTRPEAFVNKETQFLSVMQKGNDNVMRGLEVEWKTLYAQMNMLRYGLDRYDKDNSIEARTTCFESSKNILELEKACIQIWEKRDYYEKHGRLPDVVLKEVIITTDPLQLARQIQSASRQIRRYKNTKNTNSKHGQLYQDYCLQYKNITGNEYQEKN